MANTWSRRRQRLLTVLVLCTAALYFARWVGFDSPLAYGTLFVFALLSFVGTGAWLLSDQERLSTGRKILITVWAIVGISALVVYLMFP